MFMNIINYRHDKRNTKEELIQILGNYKGILTNSTIDYLRSLIELEFSVIQTYISENDRKALSELEIYKKVAIYNIYNKALTVLKQLDVPLEISGQQTARYLGVSALLEDQLLPIFTFDYGDHFLLSDKIPKDYKRVDIGTISLYQTLENQTVKSRELDLVMRELERLYDTHNPHAFHFGVYGGPHGQWEAEHADAIATYEKRFIALDNPKELTEKNKQEIEITNAAREVLLKDYGLTSESFEEEKMTYPGQTPTHLNKTLVKKMGPITIHNNIKYI